MADDDYNSQAVDWLKQNNLPGQNLTAYKPSIRDIIANKLLGDNPSFPRQQFTEGLLGTRGIGQTGKTSLADVTPLGPILDAPDMAKSGSAADNIGLIAGPMSKTASMKAYQDALGMVLGNKSREAINRMTSWFPRTEGQLAYEIPDIGMEPKELNVHIPQGHTVSGSYGQFVKHPDAFAAYPSLKKVKVEVNPSYGNEGTGLLTDEGKKIVIGGQAYKSGLTPAQLGTLAHETQHVIQYNEGWPAVGGEDVHKKFLRRTLSNRLQSLPDEHPDRQEIYSILKHLNYPKIKNSLEYDPAFNMYWRGPSEVEARNVSNRMLFGKYGVMQNPQGEFYVPRDISMSQYHNPWTTEDVPQSKQFNYWKYIKPASYY